MSKDASKLPVIVINLDRRVDRWRKFQSRMRRLRPKFVDFVVRLSAVDNKVDPIRGCLESHLQALQLAQHNQWSEVMVCEDDCYFTNNCDILWTACRNELPSDWNFFAGGVSGGTSGETSGKGFPYNFERWSSHLVRKVPDSLGYLSGTHCIVYRASLYAQIIVLFKNILQQPRAQHTDHLLFQHLSTYYIATPFIARVLERSQSDLRTNEEETRDDFELILHCEEILEKIPRYNYRPKSHRVPRYNTNPNNYFSRLLEYLDTQALKKMVSKEAKEKLLYHIYHEEGHLV